MGVKDLWNVLAPISHKKSLYGLQDKVVAIDLSCWVCEGQCVGQRAGATQPRMYLRNLYFRTQTLLLLNITPIFILDGEAPSLKLDAMKQRNDARFRHYRNTSDEKETTRRKGGRSRFRGILNQCCEMLDLMGVVCLQSNGEAEALCGQLSRDKLVDAVITQDSDVFLYGAQTVYRNLIIKAGTGSMDCYEMKDIEEKLELTREKLVAMSLLCGCDYDDGVHGVGKEMAYNYVTMYRGDVLPRLRNIRSDKDLERLEEERSGCTKCCHPGKSTVHRIEGCWYCKTTKGCSENVSPSSFKKLDEERKRNVTLELNIRRKVMSDPLFPNEAMITEYLKTYQDLDHFILSWQKPNISKFARFCSRMLEWEIEYSFEKLLPLLTRWLLLKSKSLDSSELVPLNIVKKRVVKGVVSLDIAWKVNDENLSKFIALFSESCDVFKEGCCISTEPEILITRRLSNLYNQFLDKTTKRKPAKATKQKKNHDNNDFDLGALTIKEKKPKKTASKSFDPLLAFLERNETFPSSSQISQPICCTTGPLPKDEDISAIENRSQDSRNLMPSHRTSQQTSRIFYEDCSIVEISPRKVLTRTPSCDSFFREKVIEAAPNPSCVFDCSVIFSDTFEERSENGNSFIEGNMKNQGCDKTLSSVDLEEDSTVDYDISAIIDDIVSRKHFY